MDCAFCRRLATGEVTESNVLAGAFHDAFPLSPGHCLVVPRRHEPDYFALRADEQAAMWLLVTVVRTRLEAQCAPQGYTVGINVGPAAGQTIDHVHIHIIPRYLGDVRDPRGGIRWVLPAKAAYWNDRP